MSGTQALFAALRQLAGGEAAATVERLVQDAPSLQFHGFREVQ